MASSVTTLADHQVRKDILNRIARSMKRENRAKDAYDIEKSVTNELIREAMNVHGIPAGPIMEQTGLSESRVYQRRDGK